ncbi:response regulator transcription factor [Sporosalibacterium faouarense]|uniref:response regulator transcription factor n=1 Tax=Sporosalibacterium faouarense TaxID=516123 RepID=UPI00141C4979|nr:response regulator transcription factor [Sporosalibacterium faouarense]MTI47518.1 response regulator transcription factor [Bacillota bacterium]
MKPIKVMLVDDQNLIREGLRMMLSLHEELDILSEAINGEDAFQKLKDIEPDIILMDIRMPVMDGVEATKKIKEKFPSIKIIILTTFNEDEYIFEGLKNGADGYMLKDAKSEDIVRGIKTVYDGNVLLQPEVATKVVRVFKDNSSETTDINNNETNLYRSKEEMISGRYEELTQREEEIARLVAKGKGNKEISEDLFITEGTVKNHLTRILSKLELENRTQLALYINNYSD